MDASTLEFGFDTFGDVTLSPDGQRLSPAQVVRNVVDEAVLADQVGLHSVGIGEHHRADFAISAPDVVLAAIAARTEQIRLTTAVTVLSSDDPVRLHERFATLDAISGGRAEIMLGRGSFIESFPLFGFELRDYEELFEEKLAMFQELAKPGPTSWQGRHTQPLADVQLHPAMDHPLPAWVAVGGSPESVVRAARHGLPMFLAIIGGGVERFAPFADLHRRALAELGQAPQPVAYHSPGFVAETDEAAREQYFEAWRRYMGQLARERGWNTSHDEAAFVDEIEHGALHVGSPETVARKIADGMTALGARRFHMKVSSGDLSHEAISRGLELYGTRVVPLVREMVAERA